MFSSCDERFFTLNPGEKVITFSWMITVITIRPRRKQCHAHNDYASVFVTLSSKSGWDLFQFQKRPKNAPLGFIASCSPAITWTISSDSNFSLFWKLFHQYINLMGPQPWNTLVNNQEVNCVKFSNFDGYTVKICKQCLQTASTSRGLRLSDPLPGLSPLDRTGLYPQMKIPATVIGTQKYSHVRATSNI